MPSRSVVWLLALFTAAFTWSAIRPHDYFTWFLEVLPAIVGLAILVWTYPRFQFTTLAYTLILLHAVVLMVGGHYTYAEVPVGNWVRDYLHLARNHYDRLGHFMQGFVPAILAREVFLQKRIVKRGPWVTFVAFSACMMITAIYELFEYGVAAATGSAADAFLGGQGDPWDTQNDMLMCMTGSIAAIVSTFRWHERLIEKSAGLLRSPGAESSQSEVAAPASRRA
jgi:putative membrane protein